VVKQTVEFQELTALEREALRRALGSVEPKHLRDALMRQVDEIVVKNRTSKTVGYYVDFEVPSHLRLDELPDEANKNPPQVQARHPDGENAIFFVVYIKDGALSFLEASSTSEWPEAEERILFLADRCVPSRSS
jgi:hypothetical protein